MGFGASWMVGAARRRRLFSAAALAAVLSCGTVLAAAAGLSEPDPEIVARAAQGDAEADYKLGEFFLNRAAQGDLALAAEHYRRAIAAVDQAYGPDNALSVQLIGRLVLVLQGLGLSEEERDALADQVARLRNIDPKAVAVAHSLIDLSIAQRRLGAYQQAADANAAAEGIFEANAAEDPWNRLWAGAAMFNAALSERSLGRDARAAAGFEAAASRYREMARSANPALARNAKQFLGQALLNVTELATARGDRPAALAARREIVAVLRETDPGSDSLANQLLELGKQVHASGALTEALSVLDEAEAVRMAAGGATGALASIAWERGSIFYDVGNKRMALDAYEEARARLDPANANFTADSASVLGNIALCHGDLKETAPQRDALAAQADILRRIKPAAVELAGVLSGLAVAQTTLGDNAGAARTAEEGVAILRKIQPGTLDLANALDGLGRAKLALKDYPAAVRSFSEATEIGLAADGKTKANAIVTRVMLGVTYFQMQDYDKALAELEGSLHWIDTVEQPDKVNTAAALANLASLAFQLGHYAQAEKALLRQIALLREVRPGSEDLATALYSLSLNCYYLARYEEALATMREARSILLAAKGSKDPVYVDTLRQEGWFLEGAKRYDEALKVHAASVAAALAADGRDSVEYASAISGHAWTLRWLNRLEESEAEMREALAIYEKKLGPADLATATGFVNLALVLQLRGKNEDAVRLGMTALSVFNRDARATLDGQRWCYEVLSLAFRDMGDRRRAILFAKQAINVQQKLRAFNKDYSKAQMTGFRAQWRRLYDNLADMLIAEGRIGEAQGVLAMEKEEEFVNFIQRDASADTRDSTAVLTPKESAEQGKVDALISGPMATAVQVTALVQKRDAGGLSADEDAKLTTLESALDDSYASFMDDVDAFLASTENEQTGVQKEVEAINLDYTADIQEELRGFDGQAVMLQIASLGDATHLFLTGPEASVHRQVPIKRADLARMVFEALDAIERRDPAANGKLKALDDVLIAPVAADLKASGARTVMLNLQGFLRYVPFAALTDGKRYLVEDYALSLYTPAAKTEFASAVRAPDKSVGFGVTAAHPGFAPLPGVAREIGAIFGQAGAGGALSGVASLDDKFTKASFQTALKQRPAIVHIASHFKLVPGRETDSFLLLGDGSSLSLSDIRRGRGFRFGGVDLLTLSACETARGADGEGDEFESFGALAQMNGASAVMATLWPVADEETAALMKSFYSHMMKPGITKAEALREAQLEAIHGARVSAAAADRSAVSLVSTARRVEPVGASHPYFWSPFVLMGNWM